MITAPDRVVFDAEPLIAHADDEPRSDVVEVYPETVAVEDTAGYVSCVNSTKIRDTLARKYDRATTDNYLNWLDDLGIETRDAEAVWVGASEYILTYNPTLGDSFALATAENLNATLLISGDDDYDDLSDIPIERFRDGST